MSDVCYLIVHIFPYVAFTRMHMDVRRVVQSCTLYPYGCQMEGPSPFIFTNDKISVPIVSHRLVSGVVCYIHLRMVHTSWVDRSKVNLNTQCISLLNDHTWY